MADDNLITVDFAQMDGLAADIQQQATTLQSTLDGLKERLAPAIAQWAGGTSESYQAVQRNWDESAADLQQVLAQIATAVRAAGDAFQHGERQNAARWGG